MIETRLALPVRSPTPFIVPWTWRGAGRDGGQRVGHAALGVVVAVDGHARPGRPRPRRPPRSPRRPAAAATSRWCRTGRPSRRPRRPPHAGSPARSRGRRGSRRRSARRRRRRACRALDQEGDGLARSCARFSSRSTRTTFSRCRPHVLPTIVHTGAKQSASTRRPSSSSAGTPRRRVMPKAATSACSKRSCGEQLEELELLGVRGREAGLDEVDAQLVELARDAHLLGRRQRDARALHAVAQRGVVELDVGHGSMRPVRAPAPGPATRGSARCARAGRPRTRSAPRG